MEDEEIISIIQNGKKLMPAYKATLNAEALKQVVVYVKSLRKLRDPN